MGKAETIRKRLEAAIDRVETALEAAERRREAARESDGLDSDEAAGRLADADAKSARLSGELETLEGEHAALREIADTVSDRLDKAIGELRTVLEG